MNDHGQQKWAETMPPPHWASAAKFFITHENNPRTAFSYTVLHHRSKAGWVLVNGKWVPRTGVMRT